MYSPSHKSRYSAKHSGARPRKAVPAGIYQVHVPVLQSTTEVAKRLQRKSADSFVLSPLAVLQFLYVGGILSGT